MLASRTTVAQTSQDSVLETWSRPLRESTVSDVDDHQCGQARPRNLGQLRAGAAQP
jgi:hypothetical protein